MNILINMVLYLEKDLKFASVSGLKNTAPYYLLWSSGIGLSETDGDIKCEWMWCLAQGRKLR